MNMEAQRELPGQPLPLLEAVESFRTSVNENDRLKPILKGWEPDIVLEPTDGEPLVLRVRDLRISGIESGRTSSPHVIRIQGTGEVLLVNLSRLAEPCRCSARGQHPGGRQR